MSLWLESPGRESGFWIIAGVAAAVLFLMAVMLTAIYVQQARFRGLRGAVPVLLTSYIFLQCITAHQSGTETVFFGMVVRGFGMIPGVWVVVLLLLLLAAELLLRRDLYLFRNSRITDMSLKEAVDSLPTGICCWLPGGQVILGNHAMEVFCRKALGTELVDGEQLYRDLSEGRLRTECSLVSVGEERVVLLPDGSAWSFSLKEVPFEKERASMLLLFDITETYRKTAALEAMQEEIRGLNSQLEDYNREIVGLTAEQEALQAKVKLHDELGYHLLSIRRLLVKGGTREEEEELAERLRRNITFLHSGTGEEETDEYELMIGTAAALGIRVKVIGRLPESEPQKHILAVAIHECFTNTLRHAKGTELTAEIREERNRLTAVFTNDGIQPQEEIREKGGLGGLRRMAENAGGKLMIRSVPAFSVQLELPKEGYHGLQSIDR